MIINNLIVVDIIDYGWPHYNKSKSGDLFIFDKLTTPKPEFRRKPARQPARPGRGQSRPSGQYSFIIALYNLYHRHHHHFEHHHLNHQVQAVPALLLLLILMVAHPGQKIMFNLEHLSILNQVYKNTLNQVYKSTYNAVQPEWPSSRMPSTQQS